MSKAEANSGVETADYLKSIHALMSVHSSTQMDLGSSKLERTDLDEMLAERAWLSSMMLEPKNPTFWNAFALVYMINGDLNAAEDAIDRSLEIDTSLAWTWRIWGDLFIHMARSREAERAYRMSLELEPWNQHAMRQLSYLYMRRGAFPEAVQVLNRMLLLIPNDQGLWDSLTHCVNNVP
ncbi:MAG: tetratricopeptide repeat protein [Candidatus Thorarchaeota archaeon]|jgi:Flp pilus assembly protein TadD